MVPHASPAGFGGKRFLLTECFTSRTVSTHCIFLRSDFTVPRVMWVAAALDTTALRAAPLMMSGKCCRYTGGRVCAVPANMPRKTRRWRELPSAP